MNSSLGLSYKMERVVGAQVIHLFSEFHAYKSIGSAVTYGFGILEGSEFVAAYLWQPPAPGAAKSVCPEAPGGVLSLSRMVAIPRENRKLNHVSKPLRRQMRKEIDRTRWPVLVTYSDASVGHTGHVYKCSGWEKTRVSVNQIFEDSNGRRVSTYSNGKHSRRGLVCVGSAEMTRWEHWSCPRGEALAYMNSAGWRLVLVPGKFWKSGNPQRKWVKE